MRMLKDYIPLIILAAILIPIAVLLLCYCNHIKLSINVNKPIYIRFINEEANIYQELDIKDKKVLQRMLNNRLSYGFEVPSCGFTENVAIIYDEKTTLCIALDQCGTLYWKERDRYIDISDRQRERLNDLLSQYGCRFPCY